VGAVRPVTRWRAWPWPWLLLWLALAAGTALLVRLPGPSVLDPDEHAAALYFERLVHGQHLEELLLSAPKPLLTLVYGVAWTGTHDWRAITALTVAAFALMLTALARAVSRLAGAPAALAAVLALAGSGALILQVARGNSVIWALAGWALAAEALTRPRRGWGLAAAALLAAALARAESWLLLPPAALLGLIAWRRGDRGGLLLLLPLVAPLLWLGHDWALAGDPLYSLRVPERYTDLVSGRHAVPPGAWLAQVWRRYAGTPALAALALLGVGWLAWRRAWVWLAGLGVIVVGLLGLLGVQAWRGTYISFRYFDPADAGVRVLAALGAAWLASGAVALLRRAVGAARARVAASPAAVVTAAVVAAGLAVAACWPLAPGDPNVRSTLASGARSSRGASVAVRALRPLVRAPASVVVVSGPQRLRIALELGLPLPRVRDLFLATLSQPLERALSGTVAVFHDQEGDRPPGRFARLSTTTPARVGSLQVEPLLVDPSRGIYVLDVAPEHPIDYHPGRSSSARAHPDPIP
jgi:hypothetical protein